MKSIIRGYLKKEEQADSMVRDTTCNSNIETLSYHFALIGPCYIVAIGISKFALIPGFLGSSMSGLMFGQRHVRRVYRKIPDEKV